MVVPQDIAITVYISYNHVVFCINLRCEKKVNAIQSQTKLITTQPWYDCTVIFISD